MKERSCFVFLMEVKIMAITRLLLIILSLFILKGMAYGEFTISQIAKMYSPSVVTIVALDENEQPLSLGSGFFVNSSGDVATNHHVLEGSSKAILKTLKGETGHILEVIKNDPKLDLIVVKTTLKNTSRIPFGDSDTIIVGEEIIAIGNPAGLEGTVSKGIVSGVRNVQGVKYIQITAPISPGSSGGPVFLMSGKVIGVATAYLDLGQNLNFAMPVNYLKTLKNTKFKLSSLPKMKKMLEDTQRDNSLVEVFEIHVNRPFSHSDPGVTDYIEFSIDNRSNFPIRNIQLFFVYKNKNGRVISYSAEKYRGPILPKLALQFSHNHRVSHFFGKIEVRVLDYEIDRSTTTSPADLLFKK